MEVEIYRGAPGNNIYQWGEIDKTFLERGFLPNFLMEYFGLIRFRRETVDSKTPAGNYYYPQSSGKHEFFIILGEISEEDEKNPPEAVIFRFRKAGDKEIREETLKMGYACFIPAGWSHAFLPLKHGLCIISFSNKPYLKVEEEAVLDELFKETSVEGDLQTKGSPLFFDRIFYF